MDINLELYKIFFRVCKHRNITKASAELMISQPAVSKSLKTLEGQLGGNLFIRTPKGVKLTTAGEELYKYIEKALEYISVGETKFANILNMEIGKITIGSSSTLTQKIILKELYQFNKIYPNINIEIVTDATPILVKKLKEGLIDMCIINSEKNINNKDINSIKIKEINNCFAVGKKWKELAEKEIDLEELIKYPIICQVLPSKARKVFNEFCEKNNVQLFPKMEFTSYTLVEKFTLNNFGIGFIAKEFIEEYIKKKELFVLNIKQKINSRNILLLTLKYNNNIALNELVKHFNNNEK